MSGSPQSGLEIDWVQAWKGNSSVRKGLPQTVEQALERREAPYRKYPKMMRWQDLKADMPAFGWERHERAHWQWPDQTEEGGSTLHELVKRGRVADDGSAMEVLYKENDDFRDAMDELWENELEHCREQDRKRHMAVWHRAAWAAVWCRRLRRPGLPPRWGVSTDGDTAHPTCKGAVSLQVVWARMPSASARHYLGGVCDRPSREMEGEARRATAIAATIATPAAASESGRTWSHVPTRSRWCRASDQALATSSERPRNKSA